jgi:hypothetical protein
MTISALATALAATLTQRTISTALPRRDPAMDSSLNPRGVDGASKHEAMYTAGSRPMLMEMGCGLPAFSAFMRKASRWRPGTKYMEISSAPWTHRRGMVTSSSPVSGSAP